MTATAAPFRFWVDMALECVRRDHTNVHSPGDQRGPFLTARALGLILAALHDATALASAQTPLLTVPGPSSAALASKDPIIAGGAACHQVLLLRYPSLTKYLGPAWRGWLEGVGKPLTYSPAEHAGRVYGTAVHALGAGDAAAAASRAHYPPTGKPPFATYDHRPPPTEPGQNFAGSDFGGIVMPLLAPKTFANFGTPPGRTPGTNTHYQDDFAKTKAKGVEPRSAGTRTIEEELIGTFWGYDAPPELGTPPRLYLQVALAVLDNLEAANKAALGPSEELKLIAGIAVAMADAGVSAWFYKYDAAHLMWRPAVGIWENAGGTTPQLGWLPLGRPDTNGTGRYLTPNFPAYPSGHATFGAAAFQLLRLFLVSKGVVLGSKGVAAFDANGLDNIDFDFCSDEFNGRNTDPRTGQARPHVTRGFASLWNAIVENSLSRLYLGVHWQFDGITERDGAADKFGVPATPNKLGRTGGVWLGAQIANDIAKKMGVTPATIAASKM